MAAEPPGEQTRERAPLVIKGREDPYMVAPPDAGCDAAAMRRNKAAAYAERRETQLRLAPFAGGLYSGGLYSWV